MWRNHENTDGTTDIGDSINRLVNNSSRIRKLLEFFNIPYIKKYELINSRSYDMAMENKSSLSEKKIVFLDFMVNNGENKAKMTMKVTIKI